MGFFKDLKNRARGLRNQTFTMAEQPRSLPPMLPRGGFNPFRDPPREERRPMPGPKNPSIQSVRDLVIENINTGALPPEGMSMPTAPNEAGLMPLPRPRDKFKPRNKFMPGRFPRRSPQIMPERRMPSRGPTPRFFGGGLRSIFAGLPQFMDRFEDQRGRERMSPPLPRAPLPMPQDMPRERFPMMRPGFAAGEEVNSNMLIAEQGAREGMSPPEMAAQRMREFLGETGRTVSDRDIELFSVGMLTLEDIIDRAEPVTNRNLEQQEQMFFPKEEKSFRDFQQAFKGTGLGDFLSFIPDVTQVGNYMNYKRGLGSLDDILEDLEKKN